MDRERVRVLPADPDNPSTWSPPSVSGVSPPVETRDQLLPLGCPSWEDFECLCLRLLELNTDPVHVSNARLYGVRGQAQHGIDMYARTRPALGQTPSERCYVSLQARRIKNVTPKAVSDAVEAFLKGEWQKVSQKFIYATSASANPTGLADEIEQQTTRLSGEGIVFEVWDQDAISRKLKVVIGVIKAG